MSETVVGEHERLPDRGGDASEHGARTGDGDLLADDRPHERLGRVDGTRHAKARPDFHECPQTGVVRQCLVGAVKWFRMIQHYHPVMTSPQSQLRDEIGIIPEHITLANAPPKPRLRGALPILNTSVDAAAE